VIVIRKSDERGHSDLGWLQSRFTFSFADYYEPAQMGFRALRVINDDWIAPGRGFGPHAHRDMEILTYVVQGQVLHRDSMGEQHVIAANEIQLMSAGTGVIHSEFNASETQPAHILQIWLLPEAEDLQPSYQQTAFIPAEKQGRLYLLAAPAGSKTTPATVVRQDARVYATELSREQRVGYAIDAHRSAWLQIVKGDVELNGQLLHQGDGAALSEERELSIVGAGQAGGEALLFDLA
jgi:quercetin 2,3-dioxygenase